MHKTITLNSTEYNLQKCTQKLEEDLPSWERDIFSFLVNWFSNSETIEIQTSGSTGTPKTISKSKLALKNSAILTGNFFGFLPDAAALLCLPTKYIAGKMMLVRACEWRLNLDYVEPKTQLKIQQKKYFFCAMTPPQVEANLALISEITNLIIGGAPINSTLEKKILSLPSNCFATYGMTETVSHIALRRIGEDFYTTLTNIEIRTDKRDCLVITAPRLLESEITTNDLVEIVSEKSFIWKGRLDYIINSGGVKISPELIEKQISSFLSCPFIVAGLPDKKWGEKVVLIIQGETINTSRIISSMEKNLLKTHIPKNIYFIEKFMYTENGKVKRKETRDLLIN